MHTLLHLEWPSAIFLGTACICITMIALEALAFFDKRRGRQGDRNAKD